MTLEIPQAEVRDYPGGLPAWTTMMARKLGAIGRHPNQKDSKVLGEKSGKSAATPKPHLSEHEEQANLIARVDLLAPSVPELRMLFAIPNGGARSKAVAGKLKAEGVRPGVSDLFLSVPKGCYHGLYIEMKAILGRVSEEQKAWNVAAREYGYRAEVCEGADAAWRVICEYLGIRG